MKCLVCNKNESERVAIISKNETLLCNECFKKAEIGETGQLGIKGYVRSSSCFVHKGVSYVSGDQITCYINDRGGVPDGVIHIMSNS